MALTARRALPGQTPLAWTLRDVRAPETFTVEMPLDRAALLFEWRFGALGDRRTRLTQRIGVAGENAAAYVGSGALGFWRNDG